MKYAPDKNDHCSALWKAKCAEVRRVFGGVSPFMISCWTCFVGMSCIPESEWQKLLDAEDSKIWRPVETWWSKCLRNPDNEDTFPPMPDDIAQTIVNPAKHRKIT